MQDLEPKEKRRLTYFAKQIIDMMAPTNFLATNPDALEKAVETEGQSLVQGLENLIADLEANNGELVVKLADDKAFELGRNIATAPGSVVYRNRMLELIQYQPTTEKVHTTPLLIFPPWINKFYILDLKAQNSMIRWLTDQGHTVFIASWVNPDASYADVGMAEYLEEGYVAALNEVKRITGEKKLNVVGYCIAGTTLAMALSLLKQRNDDTIKSATFFTALTDFSDQGEFTPFLSDDFIDGIEQEIGDKGILPSVIMARTFSFLRSNDLVYRPAIRSYMMGETPPAFDLLYWNGDGANLPGKMAKQYLRGLCQRNELASGGFDLLGHHLVLDEVEVPVFSVDLRNRSHRRLEGLLSRGPDDGVEGQDLRPVRIRPYRGDREPADQGKIRALHQWRSEARRRRLAQHGGVPQGVVVAALGRVAQEKVGQDGSRAPAR